MKPEVLLEELERIAEALSVRVSYENLGVTLSHGGLCRVKDSYRVIIDKRATAGEKVSTLAAALGQFPWRDHSPLKAAKEILQIQSLRRAS